MASTEPFDLRFSNIPMVNLRMEFNSNYAFIKSPIAEVSLKPPVRPVQTPLLTWEGMPDDFHTFLLQRSILGIEAYLPGALVHTSAIVGNVSAELIVKLKNPFSFRARSAVANIYHHAPAAVHPELSLQNLDRALYDRTAVFYKDVRNPLFHGKQLEKPSIEGLRDAFEHMARIYEWIDYWYKPERLLPGLSFLAGVRDRYKQPHAPREGAP